MYYGEEAVGSSGGGGREGGGEYMDYDEVSVAVVWPCHINNTKSGIGGVATGFGRVRSRVSMQMK